jgi:hypothetical protein
LLCRARQKQEPGVYKQVVGEEFSSQRRYRRRVYVRRYAPGYSGYYGGYWPGYSGYYGGYGYSGYYGSYWPGYYGAYGYPGYYYSRPYVGFGVGPFGVWW